MNKNDQSDKYLIWTDGGSRGNPGPAGAGAVVTDVAGQQLTSAAKYLGLATNNEAEYQAVILGLELASRRLGSDQLAQLSLEFHLDSELVAKQLNGQYQIKEEKLWPLFLKIWNWQIKHHCRPQFIHVGREKNSLADGLANQAMDAGQAKKTLF